MNADSRNTIYPGRAYDFNFFENVISNHCSLIPLTYAIKW